MAAITMLCPILILLLTATPTYQQTPSCAYGTPGSLTAICIYAVPWSFRMLHYRFDYLHETVQCVNCTLTILENRVFDISGNQIKTLDLTSSRIETLEPEAFIGLVFLKRLVLSNNQIKIVPAKTFRGIHRIESLNLQNNEITTLVENGFKELVSLRQLNLKNNDIANIENGSFSGLDSLEELDLSNNNIDELTFNSVPKLKKLLIMNLAGNKIKTIETNVFSGLVRVETLNLSSNPIESIEVGAFRELYSLEQLDLSNCSISNIQKSTWYSLRNLVNLNLANNGITVFATGLYSGLPELRYLNLSHNKIETYRKTGVFSLNSLHTLDLSYNNLKYLDYKRLLDHMPRLAFIDVNNNQLPCWLGKDMEGYFKEDNLEIILVEDYDDPSFKCDGVNIPSEKPCLGSSSVEERLVTEYNVATDLSGTNDSSV